MAQQIAPVGFDEETDATKIFDIIGVTGSSSTTTRDGRGRSRLIGTSPNGWNLTSNAATVIMGAAFNITSLSTGNLMLFRDTGANQIELRLGADGSLSVTRNAVAITATSGAQTTSPGVVGLGWIYLEFKALIADVGGTWEARINGVTVLTGAGDTKNTANAYANQALLQSANVGGGYLVDDVYINDGSGSAPDNDFWGDTEVLLGTPNGMGYLNNGVGTGDTVNLYNNVDEIGADGATTMNTLNNVGDLDAFTHDLTVSGTGTIRGVYVSWDAAKTASGTGTLAGGARLSGTNSFATGISLTTSFARKVQQIARPGGGTWASGDIASTQILYKAG